MKKIISIPLVILLFASCEKDPEVNPKADWKIVNIQTKIDLHEVFFVNPNVGFVAGKAPYTLVDHPHVDKVFSAWAKEVHIEESTPYDRIIETVPSRPKPSFFKTLDGGETWQTVNTP